ncbi:hypothetical protein [Neobacillus vireti]|uniref:Uncharacterized protein n=1 Tax=Neobacillus vireti LMG 21834 TaxID=1131730 RepID=A0AB94IP57_9BACI|nr:hypothetical protein [Neobacillus vireti]ETI68753.1 hypothetical protein BAVI_10974 [Neobacillus vireti LMG 21834]KLT18736.1 hypothetical protein AA980_06720 [Neobacillus vireti]
MNDENDCWLYIIEKHGNGFYKVLPIHNPALLAQSYKFTTTLWSFAVNGAKEVSLEDEIEISDDDVVEVE